MKKGFLNVIVLILMFQQVFGSEQADENQLIDNTGPGKRTASFDHEFLGGNLRFKRPLQNPSTTDQFWKDFELAYRRLKDHLEKKNA
uniref:X1.D.A1.2 n=1 Tax=Schmidtea mediterranea TaxID=79327 RepID=V9XMT1_SCHMD|nr:X1.D.A1.2 [Schmidtea mediterranea]